MHCSETHSEERKLRRDTGIVVWCYALPEFLAFSCELVPDFECEVWVCIRVVVVIGQRVEYWCFSLGHLGSKVKSVIGPADYVVGRE